MHRQAEKERLLGVRRSVPRRAAANARPDGVSIVHHPDRARAGCCDARWQPSPVCRGLNYPDRPGWACLLASGCLQKEPRQAARELAPVRPHPRSGYGHAQAPRASSRIYPPNHEAVSEAHDAWTMAMLDTCPPPRCTRIHMQPVAPRRKRTEWQCRLHLAVRTPVRPRGRPSGCGQISSSLKRCLPNVVGAVKEEHPATQKLHVSCWRFGVTTRRLRRECRAALNGRRQRHSKSEY